MSLCRSLVEVAGRLSALEEVKPALQADLHLAMKNISSDIIGVIAQLFDEKIDKEVWRQTLKELEDGGLKGPYSADELSAEVGPLWIAARRFGLQQGDKVRPIDNFAE